MCISDIVFYPDALLRAKARDVEDVHDDEVRDVIKRLRATMEEYDHCVGLAANQIGSDLNIFVADPSKNKRADSAFTAFIAINPRLVSYRDAEAMREGCMSVPDFTGTVSRYTHIEMEYTDEGGAVVQCEAHDFDARVFQHEMDHLSGKVFLDRVKSARDVFARKTYH